MKIESKKANVYIGVLVASIFLYLSFFPLSFFESLEGVIYEIQMRLDTPRNPGESKVSIVTIDDKSISKLGQWPWPRHVIAEMIMVLKNNGAKLIGIDFVFSEKEQNQALDEVRNLYHEIREKDHRVDAGQLSLCC